LASTVFEEKYCRWRNRYRKIKRPHGDRKRSCHLQQSSSIAELPVVRKARLQQTPPVWPNHGACQSPLPQIPWGSGLGRSGTSVSWWSIYTALDLVLTTYHRRCCTFQSKLG
jgi:hypothetical protein